MTTGLLRPLSQLVTTSRRVRVNLEDSDTGPRIGGNPPKGITPVVKLPATRCFMTLPPGGELLLGSKIGGRPYFYYYTVSYMDALNRLFEEGFCPFQYTEGNDERGPSIGRRQDEWVQR